MVQKTGFYQSHGRGKTYRKPVFSQKTLDQNLTQILIEHNFKTPEKNKAVKLEVK